MAYRKKKTYRKKKRSWKKKVERRLRSLTLSQTPWNTDMYMSATSITCTVNQQSWLNIQWGSKSDWNNLVTKVPLGIDPHNPTTILNTDTKSVTLTNQLVVSNTSLNSSDVVTGSNTLEVYHTLRHEIRNNEAYPVYLKIYKYVAKDADKDNTSTAPFLAKLNTAVTNMEKDSVIDRTLETLDKNNPMFRIGMLKGPNKRTKDIFHQSFKIQQFHNLRVDPGQTIIVQHKNRMIMPTSKLVDLQTGGAEAYLGGRLHGICYCLRGCIGVSNSASTAGGFMPAALQLMNQEITKARWTRRPDIKPTTSWQNPGITLEDLVAATPGNTNVATQQTNAAKTVVNP